MTTPNTRAAWMRRGLAFLAAWLLAAAWGSVAQTHWNLQALVGRKDEKGASAVEYGLLRVERSGTAG